ncbi:MAG: response regulator transcription factor [Ignavibacteriales bacterium]|jgi:two-component system alkaline phosphatase synthesis response regulator PhoP|nr:response regulator transcription factor [Ignavibacteriales bacterium]
MKKILLVDDEKDIVEFLKYNLELENFEVIVGSNGEEALLKLNENPDLIILDIMMPKLDGFETCKQIREQKKFENTPVIFLTAKSGESNEIKGLELGASDYIQKPISPKKLIARVKLNLRKSEALSNGKSEPVQISYGPIEINREKYEIFVDGEKKVFPRKEFEVLYFLVNNPGKVFGRETLLKEIWGSDVFVVDRTVDVHVRKIREKLGKYSEIIETVKGVGYRVKSVE